MGIFKIINTIPMPEWPSQGAAPKKDIDLSKLGEPNTDFPERIVEGPLEKPEGWVDLSGLKSAEDLVLPTRVDEDLDLSKFEAKK